MYTTAHCRPAQLNPITVQTTFIGWLLITALSLTSTATRADDLGALVADYRAYGLPMPCDQAKLSTLQWETGTINGVPQYRQVLALVDEPDVEDQPARYWFGCRQRSIGPKATVTAAVPSLETLADTQPAQPTSWYVGFATYPDLALAIQCAARGWHELARGLLARSRQSPQDPFHRRQIRPQDDRAAVASLAWNYWCDAFVLERGDRAHIVARLTELRDAPHGLGTPAHRNTVEDMQKTLAPRASAPDSIERVIDSLVDLGLADDSQDGGVTALESARRDQNYLKLREMRLAAVPVLLQHTHDFRMTRCVQMADRGSWHVRIADVVRELLNGLVREEFAYDFLIHEGRGKCVDDAHVLHWWSETQQVETRDHPPVPALSDKNAPTTHSQPRSPQSGTPAARKQLLSAVRAGNFAEVEKVVTENPDLVSRRLDGYPPLHWAVIDNHVDVAQFLLDKGADVNQRIGGDRPTPIFSAQTAEMAKLLIEHGANLKLKSRQSSHTPLQEAVQRRCVKVVQVLIDAGETLDFDSAVELGDTNAVVEMLAEEPWLAKPPRKPLYFAGDQGNLELVALLLQHGADPDIDFGFSNILGPFTPLSSAVTSGHYETAELLLRHGASPNVSGGRNHDNLFLFAIAYLDARFTKLMLDHGAAVVAGESWGRNVTPLHVAAASGGRPGIGRVSRVGQPRSPEGDESQVLEKVRYLVEAGADVNAAAADGSTPLLWAALAGHQQVCELLLKHGAGLDIHSACLLGMRANVESLLTKTPGLLSNGNQPLDTPALHWAARRGDVEVAALLLRHGAIVNARAPQLAYEDAGGFSISPLNESPDPTALHVAAGLGHENVVRLLLDHGAEIGLQAGAGSDARTALDMACHCGHEGTINLLLARGAKVNLLDRTAFPFDKITDTDLLSKLLDTAGDAGLAGERGTRHIAAAIADGNYQAVDLLIARGAQLDIFTACTLGRIDDVRRLLEADPASVNAVQADYPRETPIALAVENGHVDIVKLLIANGAKLPATTEPRVSALPHRAVKYGHLEVLELLLKSGCALDARDDAGSTLLHAAASGSQPNIARYLISAGADVNATDFTRATPLHVVGWWATLSRYGDGDVDEGMRRTVATARILLDAGADVHRRDKCDHTPLHRAAQMGLAGVAELLLERGADVNARDFRDKTPLGTAEDSFWHDVPTGVRLKAVAEVLTRHGGAK